MQHTLVLGHPGIVSTGQTPLQITLASVRVTACDTINAHYSLWQES